MEINLLERQLSDPDYFNDIRGDNGGDIEGTILAADSLIKDKERKG